MEDSGKMELKHSPGPWETKREYSHGPVIILGGDGKPVVVCREKRDPEEYEANVLLMSAAPELLSELIASHDREWMEDHEGIPAHMAGERPDECGACAVIVKALGMK